MADTIESFVNRIRAMSAPALAGFIESATAMIANGEADEDFGDWIEVALDRLDELAVTTAPPNFTIYR